MRGTRRSSVIGAGLCSLVLLSGCAGDGPSLPKLANLNPFAEKEVPLPGKRIAVMQAQGRSRASWPMPARRSCCRRRAPTTAGRSRAARPTTRRAILPSAAPPTSCGAPTPVPGSGSVGRLTASPIVYNGHVFTLDADGTVSAFANSGGSRSLAHLAQAEARVERQLVLARRRQQRRRLRRRSRRRWRQPLCGERLWQRRRARSADRQGDLGKAARGAGALLADGGRRSRVRRHARWPLLLPRRRRRRRALVGARPAAAGKPHQQREPGRRRRHRRRALSVRRSRRAEGGRRLVGVVGEPGAHAHDLAAHVHERCGAPGDRQRHGVRHRPCRPHDRDAGSRPASGFGRSTCRARRRPGSPAAACSSSTRRAS